jgi:branched-chain amino acid transport system substrate-binding protein
MNLRSPRLGFTALATAALLLAAAGSLFSQRGPIKIGLLVPLTGPLSANGKEMVNGITLYLEEQKQQLAGREAKLIVEDTEGKPPIALNKARALAESHGVHVLVGPLATAEAYALVSYIERQKIPTLSPTVAGEDLTQRRRSAYVVRTGWSAGQPGHPFGKWAFDTLKYRKIAMLGQDWAFGHESCGAFQRTFEEAGGQVVQKLWPPFGTTDFAPYITAIKRDVDAVYVAGAGNDALRFVRQYADAGLKGRIPLIGSGNFTDEHVLRSMGDEALGIVTALHYSAALATPANRRFVQAYEAKHQQVPSYYAEGTYVAGSVLRAALEAIGGDGEDSAKFLAALHRVKITDAPRGPVSFDDYGHPIENIYVRRVERVEGKLQNTVIHTFPAVSQFGPYRAEDYLRNPVYSRDWPPCKAC